MGHLSKSCSLRRFWAVLLAALGQGQRANDTPPTTRFHAGPRGVRVWHRWVSSHHGWFDTGRCLFFLHPKKPCQGGLHVSKVFFNVFGVQQTIQWTASVSSLLLMCPKCPSLEPHGTCTNSNWVQELQNEKGKARIRSQQKSVYWNSLEFTKIFDVFHSAWGHKADNDHPSEHHPPLG